MSILHRKELSKVSFPLKVLVIKQQKNDLENAKDF